ncbi:sugar ABC transporter substrate-binding protein [Mesorhizobium sp. M7D.F.Ca.US.005.01.1.1]|uniref:polysaccharide biosynthesis/export family protein n=1 Tax=Mesorhizobium sp. M7D.F.Ca.US.005.01.1.1 TaxID=2493678 RepID=UPI000F760722|nr:polysaccharide biosynthesis/export family protein [Mesorhizobium sp. M7D.F.Ca.US.005.01.1.1]AZO41505.1 sugar ABC transporter substrate-binding protein [Mesorhizobium sp. M7D.F.Ca.US.005.01.1.1]
MAFPERTALASVAVMCLTSMAVAGDIEPYKLSPGDAVEIGIASIADRTQRAVVQMDGNIALPEVGMVMVAGLTGSELQTRMQTLLPTKIFHVRLPDGREQMVVIKPDDVTATIADYRPIYVMGDVLTPGQQAYRPLMTVRQALAVAGGFSLLRSRAGQTGPDPVDLRRDYETLWGDYTKDYFHAARLRAELQDQADFDTQIPQGSPLSPSIGAAIAQAEGDGLKIALSDFQQEQAFLEKGEKDTADQIEVLQKREQVEAEGVKADQEDLARVTKVFESGNLTNNRLADVRRALLLSSSGALQTSVELMRARRQQEDYVRQHERNENQRKIGLLIDLKDTNARLADVTTKLHAASEKLQPTGASAQPLPIAGETIRAQVTIVRKMSEEWRKLAASEDTIVMPGDTVEARFSTDLQSAAVQ